jgi:cystathionine gamma-synthase
VHARNAQGLAEWLAAQPAVSRVFYPGLASHPGHALAARQQQGFGAIVSFELAGGIPAVRQFVSGLRCITLAESLGGVESLVAHPVTMTHAAMDPKARETAGLTDGLLRMSVGIEDFGDLQADMQSGLERIGR